MRPREDDLGFIHQFVPPPEQGLPLTLLLLHGTGGTEQDLLPLGRSLAPQAALLSPRGKVLERGMPRFFRRLAEGVFDLEDLTVRTHELAGFLERAVPAYGLDPRRLVAVGYSNGANIAASLLLLHPRALAGAVLFRSMLPFEPESRPALPETPVLMLSGRQDPLVPQPSVERLAGLLEEAGARVTLSWQEAGHGLTPGDLDVASQWLRHHFLGPPNHVARGPV